MEYTITVLEGQHGHGPKELQWDIVSCFLEKQCAKILSSAVNPYLQKLTVLDVDKERFHEYCH
jgi:hypothetical protein